MALLNYYKKLESLSMKMLDSALRGDWQEVQRYEIVCSTLIAELRFNSQGVELSKAEKKEKTKMMLNILRNDAQIRVLCEPWLEVLENMQAKGVSRMVLN